MKTKVSTPENHSPAVVGVKFVLENRGVYRPKKYPKSRVITFDDYLALSANTSIYVNGESGAISSFTIHYGWDSETFEIMNEDVEVITRPAS